MPTRELRFFNLSSRRLRVTVFLGCLLVGVQFPCCGQTSHVTKAAASDKVALLLIRDSKSLPPEFAADVVLQVLESGASLTASQKIGALKAGFDEAAQDQDDVLRRPWGASAEETSEGLHAIALSAAQLDRISQQARAVEYMAEIDPELAKLRLGAISPPRLDPIPCKATWIYLPDAYYNAVAKVIGTSFSPEEISAGRRAELLTSVANGVVSHSQLLPVTRLLASADLSGAELASVLSSYIYALDRLRGDAHSFYWTAGRNSVDEFAALVSRLDSQGIGALPLITSIRRYIVANFNTMPCSPLESPNDGKLPVAVQDFNNKFSKHLNAAGLSLITGEEIEGAVQDTAPAEVAPPRWESKEMSDLILSLQKLPDMPRENSAIEARYKDYLLQLNGWSNRSEPESDFFHQKAMLYFGVIERLGPSAMRTNVLIDFVKFLEQNSYHQVSRVDWFFYARRLLNLGARPAERADVVYALVSSGDPVLSIYGRLELWKGMHASSQVSVSTKTTR